jgi:site-specific recombinase XerD
MIDYRGVRLRGPLAAYRDGVWSALLARGYSPLSGLNLLRVMANLSRWMARRRLQPRRLDERRVQQFLRYRRRTGFIHWRSPRGLSPILDYLRGVGVIPAVERVASSSPLERVLQNYERYLEQERGCTLGVVERNRRTARALLEQRICGQMPRLRQLRPDDITRFMLEDLRTRSFGYVQLRASALRSFLRYLHIVRLSDRDLSAAVPRARRPRFRNLPKDLPPRDISRILRTLDSRTPVGCRDRALFLLLARLGLRRSEVVALRLEDVDWRAGEIIAHGKGARSDRLPLPHDVGVAMAAYVQHGRPRRDSRRVFLQARAPYRDLTTGALTGLVRELGARAGVAGLSPHRLRHTAATQMLRKGASLQEIAQVLRHRHLGSTAIYARVDDAALRPLARSWPEATR